MYKDIFISINPIYIEKIIKREKLYELRNFNTKFPIKQFFIYETSPSKRITYIAKVKLPVTYPHRIKDCCCESYNFNNGISKYKKAYEIEKLYKLTSPLSLKTLKDEYEFTAPQSYTYTNKYPDLLEEINKIELIKVF